MKSDEWLDRFAVALGVPAPDADEMTALLELAGVAAHASERMAAPISCWMVALSGVSIADALIAAQELGNSVDDSRPD